MKGKKNVEQFSLMAVWKTEWSGDRKTVQQDTVLVPVSNCDQDKGKENGLRRKNVPETVLEGGI